MTRALATTHSSRLRDSLMRESATVAKAVANTENEVDRERLSGKMDALEDVIQRLEPCTKMTPEGALMELFRIRLAVADMMKFVPGHAEWELAQTATPYQYGKAVEYRIIYGVLDRACAELGAKG